MATVSGMSSWTWIYEDSDGRPLDPAALGGVAANSRFPSQAEAESWVGECWQALLAQGVEAVRLTEDGVEVYGPMSLRPAQ